MNQHNMVISLSDELVFDYADAAFMGLLIALVLRRRSWSAYKGDAS